MAFSLSPSQTSSPPFRVLQHTFSDCDPSLILTLFADVESRPWSFLLDSCGQTKLEGRFDIITSAPCLTYEFTRGVYELTGELSGELNSKLSGECPYQHLAHLQTRFNNLFDTSGIVEPDLPFIIGALSVFAYDGNTSSDNIQDSFPQQYAIPDISVGFYHSSLIYDNDTQSLYVFSIDEDFISRTKTKVLALQKPLTDKTCRNDANGEPFLLLEPWQSNMSKAFYHEQFAKIEEYLRAGDCYQVNFAQRFHARYQGSEWQAYCQLRQANNAPFSAYVRLPSSVVLSLSPERFLRVKDDMIVTKPIKGTRKRSDDPVFDKALSDELLSAEKDRAENLMIVDLLRNDLSKHCEAHSVKVPELFALESYPAVHHMVSTVVGKLKSDASVYDLLKGAFPGGSITGAPKVRAMQIIQELEPDKRGIYCGSIGYVGIRGDMDTNICIRTLLAQTDKFLPVAPNVPADNDKKSEKRIASQTHNTVSKNTAQATTLYCWAGGGIVIDSKNDDEYLESLHKVAKILPILSMTDTVSKSTKVTK